MSIGFSISATIMGTIFFLLLFLLLTQKNSFISLRQLKNLLIIFGLALVLFSYFFVPNSSIRWDLLEHYEEVNALRGQSFSYALETSWYSGLYYLSLIYSFIISRFSTNQLLPVLPILIDYACFMYIFIDRLKEEDNESVSAYEAIFTFIVWFSTFGLKLAISGMRCVTACAIASLGIYLYCKNKKTPLLIVLIGISALIHSFSLVIVIIWLISKMRHKVIIPIFMIVFDLLGLNALQNIRSFTNNAYITFSVKKMIRYWNRFTPRAVYEKSGFTFLVMFLCMIFVIVLLMWYLRRYGLTRLNVKQEDDRIYNYMQALSYFSVGMCFNYLFMERTMYLLSYGFLMLLPTKTERSWRGSAWSYILLVVVLFILYRNDIGTFIVNYR